MTKTDNGAEYPASAYAYVPDAQEPSMWKLRLWETPETKVTAAQLGRAAAALSSGGFRGEKAQIPAGDLAKVKARIRGEYSKLGTKPADQPESIQASEPEFLIDISAITLSDSEDKPTRIPLAILGTFYKGKQKFSITRADIAKMSENFKKRGNGEAVLDYEHASQFPEMAAGGPVPAAGWITDVEPEPDSHGIAWGLAKLTTKARELIANKEYKYISPVINWGARDKSTGDPQGATLASAALTNTPVLDRMPAITLSDAGWQALSTNEGENTDVAKEPVMCSVHTKTPMLCPTCDKDQIDSLAASEAERRAPKILQLSDVTRNTEGRITLGGVEFMAVAVHNAIVSEALALSEVDAAVAAGRIAPANKTHYTKIALSDIETFRAITKDLKQVDLSERGHGGTGPGVGGGTELDRINSQLDEKARARMKADSIEYPAALKLVASENRDLIRRKNTLQIVGER